LLLTGAFSDCRREPGWSDSRRGIGRDLRDIGGFCLVADRRRLEPGRGRRHPGRRGGGRAHRPRPGPAARPVVAAAPRGGPGGGLRADRGRGLSAVLLQRHPADAGRGCPAAGIPGRGAGGRLAVAAPRPAPPAAHRRRRGRGDRRAGDGARPGRVGPDRPGRGDVGTAGRGGSARLHRVGVMWGLLAAGGLAIYFLLGAATDEEPLPPIVMAWAGMCVGAVALGALGWIGVLALTATTGDVGFLGHRVSWAVPVLGLSLVAAVIAYVAGIGAARRLRVESASFILGAVVPFAT